MEKLRKMEIKKSVKKFLYEFQNPLQKWVFKSKSLNTGGPGTFHLNP